MGSRRRQPPAGQHAGSRRHPGRGAAAPADGRRFRSPARRHAARADQAGQAACSRRWSRCCGRLRQDAGRHRSEAGGQLQGLQGQRAVGMATSLYVVTIDPRSPTREFQTLEDRSTRRVPERGRCGSLRDALARSVKITVAARRDELSVAPVRSAAEAAGVLGAGWFVSPAALAAVPAAAHGSRGRRAWPCGPGRGRRSASRPASRGLPPTPGSCSVIKPDQTAVFEESDRQGQGRHGQEREPGPQAAAAGWKVYKGPKPAVTATSSTCLLVDPAGSGRRVRPSRREPRHEAGPPRIRSC